METSNLYDNELKFDYSLISILPLVEDVDVDIDRVIDKTLRYDST